MKYKYNKKADAALAKLYRSVGARSWHQKFNLLELTLGITPGSSCFSHKPTWEAKTGSLEYELLHRLELIELVLA
jgi:hypothetical protein